MRRIMKDSRTHHTGRRSRSFLQPLFWLVGIIAVTLAVLKFVFALDFGFFKTTFRLRATAMTLEEVKAVESLVAAEYFGEVIGTARDYFVRRAVPDTEKLLLRLMNEPNPAGIALTPFEETLLNGVRGAIVRRGGMNPRLVERVTERTGALEMVKPEFQNNHLDPGFIEAFIDTLLIKRDIAFLARGAVQAGYDLAKLDETKYYHGRSNRTIYLLAEPTILAKDINPWFIYDPAAQNFVKGFEIITQAGIDLEEDDALDFIKAVKEECRQRLLDDALRNGLKDRARISAEATLTALFRMFDAKIDAVRLVARDEFEKQKAAGK
jgi:hypothetical protein